MKKKKMNKKLSLNKETISKLDSSKIKGGWYEPKPTFDAMCREFTINDCE